MTAPRPPDKHVLCGTCVGEFKRKAGYFESKSRRDAVLDMREVPPVEGQAKEYCCNCGACSRPDATVTFRPGSRVCDGDHEAVEE